MHFVQTQGVAPGLSLSIILTLLSMTSVVLKYHCTLIVGLTLLITKDREQVPVLPVTILVEIRIPKKFPISTNLTKFAPLNFVCQYQCQCITHLKITREDAITKPSSIQLVLFLFIFNF